MDDQLTQAVSVPDGMISEEALEYERHVPREGKPRGKNDPGGLPFEGVVIRWERTTEDTESTEER